MNIPLITTITILQLLAITFATHFRGGTFSWQMVDMIENGMYNVSYHIRLSWRRDYEDHGQSYYMCTQADIDSHSNTFGHDSFLKCTFGCTGNIGSLDIICTDFDENDDWMTGTNVLYQETAFQDLTAT